MAARYILTLFQTGRDFIDRKMVDKLQIGLSKITSKPEDTEIDIWIDSPGGSAHAAYKLWLELRSRANKLRAWVPDYAKSAATLLVLGMDEIYMGKGAELGPLDAQIEHPDRERTYISALDLVGALDYFSSFAVQLAITGGAAMVKYTQLPRTDILCEILPFAAKLIEPCVNKIDPTLTRRAVSQLQVAEHYARRMLAERNVPKDLRFSEEDAEKLTSKLVKEYPVHECVIGRQEAKALGLPIYEAEKDKLWPKVNAVYRNFSEVCVPQKKSLLGIVPFNDIVKNNAMRTIEQKPMNKKKGKKTKVKKGQR